MDLHRCAYAPVGFIFIKHVDLCVCVLMCVLVETNVVLMLMRSLSSLATVSGIEFLLGNRTHQDTHIHTIHPHQPLAY